MVLHSSALMRPTPVHLTSIKRPRVLLRPGPFRASVVSSALKARFVAKRTEATSVQQLQRPLVEYMSLPASQYSVLDAERIERADENTFRCYMYRIKFFAFEVCPVLVVRVEEEPYGCCIRLLSCKLEGSPLVEAQNEKFSASMVNKISCNNFMGNSGMQQLTTDTAIEVTIEIPFAFQVMPVEVIESTGTQVLEQLLRITLPRFLKQAIPAGRKTTSFLKIIKPS